MSTQSKSTAWWLVAAGLLPFGCLLPDIEKVSSFGDTVAGSSTQAGASKGGNSAAGTKATSGGAAGSETEGGAPTEGGSLTNGGSPNGGAITSGGAMTDGGSITSGGSVTDGGSVTSGGSVNGGAGMAGAGGTTSDYCDDKSPLELPMVLTDHFVPSGYLNESYLELTNINEPCPNRPAGSPVGTCSTFEWQPDQIEWVGVVWQDMPNNWSGPGTCIAEGATQVILQARATTAGVDVTFAAAGRETTKNLTTSWQTFVIDLTGVDYNAYSMAGGVNTGLTLVIQRDAADTTTKRVFIDDVRWAE